MAFDILKNITLEVIGNQIKSLLSLTWSLQNRITKIPNCRKRRLFCGKWLTIKVVKCLRKAAGKTILNWQRLRHTAHVVIHFSVLVFSGNLNNLEVMKGENADGQANKWEMLSRVLYILRLPLLSWSVFEVGRHSVKKKKKSSTVFWTKMEWEAKEEEDECHSFLKVTGCCPILLHYQSLGHSNYP